jgi:hypothetical protein
MIAQGNPAIKNTIVFAFLFQMNINTRLNRSDSFAMQGPFPEWTDRETVLKAGSLMSF